MIQPFYIRLVFLVTGLSLVNTQFTDPFVSDLLQANTANPITEEEVREALICQKEISFARDYFFDKPESLDLYSKLVTSLKTCKDEISVTGA